MENEKTIHIIGGFLNNGTPIARFALRKQCA